MKGEVKVERDIIQDLKELSIKKDIVDFKYRKLITPEEFAFSLFMSGGRLDETSGTAYCPSCKKMIYSKKIYNDGGVSLIKYCPYEDKKFITLVEKNKDAFNNKDIEINKAPHLSLRKLQNEPITEDNIINYKDVQNILFLITHRCNENCRICYDKTWNPREDMSIEFIKEKVKLYKKHRIVLYGGEPTVRDDIFEIIKLINNSGNYSALFSNCLRLADAHFLRNLLYAGLDVLYFSFDGFKEGIYEKLRGGRHDYEIKMRAWDNLIRENQKGNLNDLCVTISPTFIKGINEDQIKDILDFTLKHDFISEIFSRPLYLPENRGFNIGLNEDNLLSREEIDELVCEAIGLPKIYFDLFYDVRLEFLKYIKSKFKNLEIMYPKRHQIFLERDNGKFVPLFTVKELMEIRNSLKKRKFYRLFFKKKYLKLASCFIKSKFNPTEIEKNLAKMKIVRVAPTSQPIDYFLNSTQITGICYGPTGICGMKYWT